MCPDKLSEFRNTELIASDCSPHDALMSGAAKLALPGVVKWVPLSVRIVSTL